MNLKRIFAPLCLLRKLVSYNSRFFGPGDHRYEYVATGRNGLHTLQCRTCGKKIYIKYGAEVD